MDERFLIWGAQLLKEYGVDYQDFNLEDEIDSSLDWEQNKTILIEKLKHLGSFDSSLNLKEIPETMSKTTEKAYIGQLKQRINEMVKISNHWVVLGSRGEGKSSFAYYLLELHKPIRPIYAYNHPQPSLLPKWIYNITKLEQLPDNAVCLIDESSNDFDQYSYAKRSNTYLRDVLTKARHKNQSFIFVTLTSKFINLNFLYLIGSWILKQPSLFQKEEERKIIKLAYSKVNEDLKKDEFIYMDDKISQKGRFIMPEWFVKLTRAYSTIEAELI